MSFKDHFSKQAAVLRDRAHFAAEALPQLSQHFSDRRKKRKACAAVHQNTWSMPVGEWRSRRSTRPNRNSKLRGMR